MLQSPVTVHLPNTTLDQLRRTARQQRKTVEDVVRDLVVREVTPLPSLPDDVEEELAAFQHLSVDVLLLLAQNTLSPEQQNEIAQLNQEAQQRTLAPSEQNKQDHLVALYERVLVRRAEASKILKERGYDLYKLPDPSTLS
jgi:rhodanese-related sulfurtransferase